MLAPKITDLKVFVPAKDFAVSRAFYLALGGRINWEAEELAEFGFGSARFLLQDFYVKDWAENFVMQLVVEDAGSWYALMQGLIEEGAYPGIRVRPPKVEPWGQTISYAWDPSGILLHFAQETKNTQSEGDG